MRCLIVDDEPLARRVLARHIAAVPSLELIGECGSAAEAAACLHEQAVDVIFLDIEMPEMTGLDFLKTLPDRPRIILTTAYSEYALEGYEYAVVDYLLKPISFERFLTAVNRLPSRPAAAGSRIGEGESAPAAQGKSTREPASEPDAADFIFLRADRVDHKVAFDDISVIEGYGNYVKVHTDRGTIMTAGTLAAMEESLPRERFLRVHRSYIVAVSRIEQVESTALQLGRRTVPIGSSYRRGVLEILDRYSPSKRPSSSR